MLLSSSTVSRIVSLIYCTNHMHHQVTQVEHREKTGRTQGEHRKNTSRTQGEHRKNTSRTQGEHREQSIWSDMIMMSSGVLLLYGCQVTTTVLRGEKSNRDVFGRSKVDTTEPSEDFTTETLKDRQVREGDR